MPADVGPKFDFEVERDANCGIANLLAAEELIGFTRVDGLVDGSDADVTFLCPHLPPVASCPRGRQS